jgi:hypothetical protein
MMRADICNGQDEVAALAVEVCDISPLTHPLADP